MGSLGSLGKGDWKKVQSIVLHRCNSAQASVYSKMKALRGSEGGVFSP